MLEFKSIQSFDDTKSELDACLVQAFFANLEIGLKREDIPSYEAHRLHRELMWSCNRKLKAKNKISGSAADLSHLTVTEFVDLLNIHMQDQDNSHFHHRESEDFVYDHIAAATLQPSWAFKFWLRNPYIPEKKIDDPDPSDLIALCETFKLSHTHDPEATIGKLHDVVWLTPYKDQVQSEISDAQTRKLDDPARQEIATRLREMMGLFRREAGDHAVMAISKSTLREMAEDEDVRLAPPTILDSRGYERFRHWPTAKKEPGMFGRTYDLNSDRRRAIGENHGMPELIRREMHLSDVDEFIYVGKIGHIDEEAGALTSLESAQAYATELAGDRTNSELIDDISERIA